MTSWTMQKIGKGKKLILLDGILTNGMFALKVDFLQDTVTVPAEIRVLHALKGAYMKTYGSELWTPIEKDEMENLRKSFSDIFAKREGALKILHTRFHHMSAFKNDPTLTVLRPVNSKKVVVANSFYHDPLMARPDMECYWSERDNMFFYVHKGELVGVVTGMAHGTAERVETDMELFR